MMQTDRYEELRKALDDYPQWDDYGNDVASRIERMRDIRDWKAAVAEEASPAVLRALLAERDALRTAIDAHNSGCDGQCEWRQQNGSWAALCADYKSRGQSCPDCPRDNRIDAAISSEGEQG